MTAALFWITLFSLILLPPFPGAGPGIRLDDVAPFLWLAALCLGLINFRLNAIARWRLFFFAVFATVMPLSIAYGTMVGFDGTSADFIQIIRLVKYAAIYLMAAAYFDRHDPDRALRRINLFGLILFGIAVSQYFNFLGLNERYVEAIAPTQFHTLVNDYPTPRPVGMLGNPNELGFLFVILAVFAAYRASRSPWALLSVGVFAAGVAITLSRSAMMAFAVGLALYAVRSMFPATIPTLIAKVFLAIVVLAGTYAVLFHTEVYDAVTWRFVEAMNLADDLSFAQRVENWSENVAIIKDHLLIGVGPLRRVEFEHSADNEWLLMLRSYGLVGTLALIALLVIPTFQIAERRARIAAWSLLAAGFVYMLPAALFHSLVLFPLVMVFLACCDRKISSSAPSSIEFAPVESALTAPAA